jgi:two-component system OmpR family response regulator
MEITLTGKEWALLERLCQNPKQITNKSELQDAMYSFNQDIESNAIEVHISQLRKKLGSEVIETVRGIGYKLKEDK